MIIRCCVALAILTAAPGSAGLVPAADAQTQTQAPTQRQDRAARLLKSLDKDQDGTIDLNEAKQAATARFDRLDPDKDGTLTLQEFEAPLQRALGRAQPGGRPRLSRALAGRETGFKAMDKDHDGTVSKDEYLAEVAARFGRADRDHEGTLSVEELRTPAGRALTALL